MAATLPRWHARGEFAGRAGSAKVLNAHRIVAGCAASRQRGPCGRGSVVEHHLAKVRVAGSNPVVRSEVPDSISRADVVTTALRYPGCPCGGAGGGMAEWLRQGPAKPCTRVRFPLPPRGRLAQRESTSLTRKGSLVQIQYRPPDLPGRTPDNRTSAQHLGDYPGDYRPLERPRT